MSRVKDLEATVAQRAGVSMLYTSEQLQMQPQYIHFLERIVDGAATAGPVRYICSFPFLACCACLVIGFSGNDSSMTGCCCNHNNSILIPIVSAAIEQCARCPFKCCPSEALKPRLQLSQMQSNLMLLSLWLLTSSMSTLHYR